MAKLNWTPWMGLEDFKEEMDRLMDEFIASGRATARRQESSYFWQPAADVYETEQGLTILVELPGMGPDHVNLEVRGREIWIYGERRFEKEVRGSVYQVLERSYGPFARRFDLPRNMDGASLVARMKNGLLEVQIRRKPDAAQCTRIHIDGE